MSLALSDEARPLEERLTAYLGEAHRLLSTLPLTDFLAFFLGEEEVGWATGEMTGHLHLGFLTPAFTAGSLLEKCAVESGFNGDPARYQSEVMARDLGHRLGRDTVATTIFKASASRRDRMCLSIEAFTPEVESNIANAWVKARVGTHFGLGLLRPDSVRRALELSSARGLHTPDFLGGAPATNSAQEISVAYIDSLLDGEPLRWEFYHCASETTVAKCSESALMDG